MSIVIETPTPRIDVLERPQRSGHPGFLADTWNVMVRELKPVFREPASVLFAMVQPLVFLGLFAPLLPEVENGSALQWFVPGIIAMTALMGASFTGANLTQEIMTGSHERLLVSPLSRSSLMVGRALKEVVPMLMQTAIILLVVTPFSFELHLGGVLVAGGLAAGTLSAASADPGGAGDRGGYGVPRDGDGARPAPGDGSAQRGDGDCPDGAVPEHGGADQGARPEPPGAGQDAPPTTQDSTYRRS